MMKRSIVAAIATLALACLGLGLIWTSEARAADQADVAEAKVEQVGQSTSVLVSIPAESEADTATVKATLSYQGEVKRAVEREVGLASAAESDGTRSFEVDLGTYGPFSVDVTLSKGDETLGTSHADVAIVADEYNIAPLLATLPVTTFSVRLFGEDAITVGADGQAIPTIVALERTGAYNWNELPEGVYGLPYLSAEELSHEGSSSYLYTFFRDDVVPAMADYVQELHRLNPASKFNLYLNDNTANIVHRILYANAIPEELYRIVFISDGTGSYSTFTRQYPGDDPQATHDALVAEWNAAKARAYETGTVDPGFAAMQGGIDAYVAVDAEPASQWWLGRPALLVTNGDENAFGQKVQANTDQVIRIYMNDDLAKLQETEGAAQAFKDLYNFNDAYFADAESQGKDVMVLLGTTLTTEANFAPYARFTEAFYGDEFAYYYKGHPATPTDLSPEKQEQLRELAITDVDSSVPAEIILFFYPDIHLSGYGSTTFMSVEDPSMAKGLFGQTKASALANEDDYPKIMDWFISPIDDTADQAIRDLCENDESYLVEFSDELLADADYDLAIWDDELAQIRYYAEGPEGYELVDQTLPVQRLYNPYSGDHHLTADVNELRTLADLGWEHEGVAFYAAKDGVEVHRLYNPFNGDHFYTADADEIAGLTAQNWGDEGVAFDGLPEAGVPIWRLWNSLQTDNGGAGSHLWTSDPNEYDTLPTLEPQGAWHQEDVAWYAAAPAV